MADEVPPGPIQADNLRCLAAGETPDEIIAGYPPLTLEDIRAAQAFAANHLARESVFAAE